MSQMYVNNRGKITEGPLGNNQQHPVGNEVACAHNKGHAISCVVWNGLCLLYIVDVDAQPLTNTHGDTDAVHRYNGYINTDTQ